MLNIKSSSTRRTLFIIAILLLIALAVFLIVHGQTYLTRRGLRDISRLIRSFGVWSPLILISLITISTLVPPLPLPIPLVELAAGIIFGFGSGFLLVWFSQILSSYLAFRVAKFLGRKFFKKFIGNKILSLYQEFLEKKGPLAVFTLRATMGAPFNIVSYLSGFTQMRTPKFLLATILGTIPEAIIATFIGSRLRSLYLSLWHFFIGLVIVGTLGTISTLVMVRFIKPSVSSRPS